MKQNLSDREYASIHHWLKSKFGKAKKCSFKKCSGKSKNYHWALRKGKKYDYKKSCFIELCVSCHAKYDMTPYKIEKARNNLSSQKTHCIHGHPFKGENLVILKWRGWRKCRTCQRIETHKSHKKKALEKLQKQMAEVAILQPQGGKK